ncbi:MAG: WHG domain-containing protein [Arenicellales bacterium]
MPRAGLSREVVVAEASRLADKHGYDKLTLAAIAQHFGVAVPSLYKHVAGLPAVQRELAVLAVSELGDALRSAIQGAQDNGLRAMAGAYRAYARLHPGRYAATLRAPAAGDAEHRAVSDAVLATVFRILEAYGLEDADLVDAARTLRAALHGFVALESNGAFGLPQDVDRSFDRLVDALDAALEHWRRAGAHPGRR